MIMHVFNPIIKETGIGRWISVSEANLELKAS